MKGVTTEYMNHITEEIKRIVGVFSDAPMACVFLTSVFAFASVCCCRGIAGGLLEMHRSRSNLKKVRKPYSAWQKMIMKPAWDHCLHAKSFCRFLIIFHHVRVILLLISLALTIVGSAIPALMTITGALSACVFFVMDVPALVLHVLMDRYPLQRLKHEYRFRKYHNTQNHHSLF